MNKKILILSDTLPGNKGGHGVILLNQILYYGVDRFCIFSPTTTPKDYKQPIQIKDIPTKISPVECLFGIKTNRFIKKILFLEEIIFFISLQFRKREILEFAQKNEVMMIYAILRGKSSVLAHYISEKTNLPLVSYIPDTIDAEIYDKPLIHKIKEKSYYQSIRKSRILAAPGITMVDYFKREFDKDSVIFSSILKKNSIPGKKEKLLIENELIIAFAGSLYATKEFEQFAYALSEFASKQNSYTIKLLIISDIKPNPIPNVKIEFHNWTTQEKTLQMLSKADIAYLPYPFDEKYKKQMTLAFPSKIVSYLALQIPVFFHGPDYSSVNFFINKYHCGINCNSIERKIIINRLEEMVYNPDILVYFRKQCATVFEEEFSEDKLNNNFSYFISQGLKAG
jgi:hypothetical protein